MSTVIATQVNADADLEEIENNATLNQKTEIINALATQIVMPNQVLQQSSTQDFGGLILSGNHGGFQAKNTHNRKWYAGYGYKETDCRNRHSGAVEHDPDLRG